MRRLFTVQGVRYVALLALVAVLAGGEGYAAVERGVSLVDGVYWSFGTMTTVGFGEQPHTDTGKLLGVALVLIGVGFVAILTGSLARRFIEPAVVEIEEAEEEIARSEEDLLVQVRDISSRLDRLERALAGRRSGSI